MDYYFPIFFTIVGTAACMGLLMVSAIMYITSREPHPPVERNDLHLLGLQKEFSGHEEPGDPELKKSAA